jgi:RNA ligase
MPAASALDAISLSLPAYLPPWETFVAAVREGLVTVDRAGPLLLLNYAKRATWERRWDLPAVRAARGLVVHADTGEIVAAPFPKFFNYGEPVAVQSRTDSATGQLVHEPIVPPLPPGLPEVTLKLDGSLGIGFRDPEDGHIRWATRGRFGSPQGAAARALWEARYRDRDARLRADLDRYTLLSEIIHPATRQIVPYDFEDLVLIGVRDRFTGRDLAHSEVRQIGAELGLSVVDRLDGDFAAAQVLVAGLDHRTEGVVCRWELPGCPLCAGGDPTCPLCGGAPPPFVYRCKLKGAEYLRYVRWRMACTPRAVARAWAAREDAAMLPAVPEELRPEVEAVLAQLDGRERAALVTLQALYDRAPGSETDQKAFALWVQTNTARADWPYLFQLRKGLPPELRRAIAEAYSAVLPPDDLLEEG